MDFTLTPMPFVWAANPDKIIAAVNRERSVSLDALAVSFQEVVHSVATEDAEVARLQ